MAASRNLRGTDRGAPPGLLKGGSRDGIRPGAKLRWDGRDVSYILTNVVAILLATCAGLGIGLAYQVLPQRRDRGARVVLFITAFIAEFWLAAILAGALILAPPQADPWVMAIASAVVIWIGFVVPILAVTHVFRELPASAIVLDGSHWLVVMVVQAAVLHGFGLVHP